MKCLKVTKIREWLAHPEEDDKVIEAELHLALCNKCYDRCQSEALDAINCLITLYKQTQNEIWKDIFKTISHNLIRLDNMRLDIKSSESCNPLPDTMKAVNVHKDNYKNFFLTMLAMKFPTLQLTTSGIDMVIKTLEDVGAQKEEVEKMKEFYNRHNNVISSSAIH
jgi:hypothetical protein